jgi:hypothetical protein
MKTSLVLSTAIAYRRCVNVQIFQHISFWVIHFTQIYLCINYSLGHPVPRASIGFGINLQSPISNLQSPIVDSHKIEY